jgi:hypothetical protein
MKLIFTTTLLLSLTTFAMAADFAETKHSTGFNLIWNTSKSKSDILEDNKNEKGLTIEYGYRFFENSILGIMLNRKESQEYLTIFYTNSTDYNKFTDITSGISLFWDHQLPIFSHISLANRLEVGYNQIMSSNLAHSDKDKSHEIVGYWNPGVSIRLHQHLAADIFFHGLSIKRSIDNLTLPQGTPINKVKKETNHLQFGNLNQAQMRLRLLF